MLDEAQHLAEFAAGEMDRLIDAKHAALLALFEYPSTRQGGGAECSAYAARMKSHFAEMAGLAVMDARGQLVCTALPGGVDALPGDLGNFGSQVFFTAGRDAAEAFFVGTYTARRLPGQAALPLSLKLPEEDGKFAGLVSSALDIGWLNEYFAGKSLPRGATLAITDRAGTILVRVPRGAGLVGTKLIDDVRWMMDEPMPGASTVMARDGVERLTGYVPKGARTHGLFVAVGIARETAIAPVREAALRDAGLLVLTLVIAMAVAGGLGRVAIQRPLARIERAVAQWKSGERSARTGLLDGPSEIRTVGAGFDRMADAVATRERELEVRVGELNRALAHKAVLTDELNHRVKNTLVTVQSIARLTIRPEHASPGAVEDFLARLRAMAAAHDILTRESWTGAWLADIVTRALEPYAGTETATTVAGPAIRLSARAALATAMGLHELCTNAAKYGALSVAGGRIDITWTVDDALRRLRFRWREADGPMVAPPGRRGFGSRMIERMLAQELGGTVGLRFDPAGVVCEIEIALDEVAKIGAVADGALAGRVDGMVTLRPGGHAGVAG